MRVPGLRKGKTLLRWVQARLLGGALIIGYHRIANVTNDEYEVCVSPKHFAEQMEMLGKHAHPVSLTKLVDGLKNGSLPPRSVAVTFDDGYADNLYEAKPILEKHAIPATVFVCTGYAGKEFWWDELERLVMSSKAEVGALRLQAGKNQFVWSQPKVSPEADLNVRRKLQQALYNFLLTLDVEEQDQAMNTIRVWSEISSDKTTARAMNRNEILQLADHGFIEIGAHTRHHPMLLGLPSERLQEEIVSSKIELEDILGRRISGFAYPYGKGNDDAKGIVREAGYAFACTSLHDVVRPGSDLYELTRFWQRDVDGEKFWQGLQLWMR